MATGRIGVTPVLRTRWSKLPTTGTTSLSGLDDNSVALVYDAGYEAVYRNGVLLSRGNDYTATDGTSITLTDATLAGDIIEVFANDLVPLTDAISKGQYTAKGALLSASAASTPAVLTVGSNNQVLTADSAETTGLKWATPSNGGMTQLATGTLSSTSVVISSISQSYKHLQLDVFGATTNTGDDYWAFRFNGLTAGSYTNSVYGHNGATAYNRGAQTDTAWIFSDATTNMYLNGSGGQNHLSITIYDYTSTTPAPLIKSVLSFQPPSGTYSTQLGSHSYKASSAAITSLTIRTNSGQTFTAGTYILWGIA